MPAPVTVKNSQDSWTNQNQQSKNYNNKDRMWLRDASGDNKYAWIFFTKPWPSGATIISATLRVYNVQDWSGSVTLTVQRANAKWSVNRINWNNQPGATGATAQRTRSGANPNTEWDIDVTSLVQAIANGAAWYGFRITTNRATDGSIWSSKARRGALRPTLEVEWTTAPDQPENLRPGGGRYVTSSDPYLVWDSTDDSGDKTVASVQVQMANTQADANAGTNLIFDSGEVPSSLTELDLNTTGFTGLTDGQVVWWRARNKDGSGLWSQWSEAVSFGRLAKGTLTITAPTAGQIWEGSPEVTWTLTGTGITQRAWQVIVKNEDGVVIHDSGKITSGDQAYTIPFGTIKDAEQDYTIRLLAWDTANRESVPNEPAYYEAVMTGTISYDNAVAPVTSLSMLSDGLLPIAHITWSRSTAPDFFQIQRSNDGVSWTYVDEVFPAEVLVSGTNYAWDDVGVPMYKNQTWRVLAVVGGRQSGTNPTETGQVRRLAPFLMRANGDDAVCFLNPRRERSRLDVQGLHRPMAGPPVLVTQYLGGLAGSVAGRLTEDPIPGVDAKAMYNRWRSLRKDSGQTFKLAVGDEVIDVVTYEMVDDLVIDSQGITYEVSFQWAEV